MENATYIGLSRQMVLRRQLDVVANNIANASTTAYKGERSLFVTHLAKIPHSNRLAYVRDQALFLDTRVGGMTRTENRLDVALRNDGHFVVDTPQGPRYTRNGHFHLDSDGRLVTANGHPVLLEGDIEAVFEPTETDIRVARDGTVSAGPTKLGRLQIVRFENPQTLLKAGDSLYAARQAPQPVEKPDLVQGAIEESNVEPIVEMTRMISLMRSYQSTKQMLDGEHQRQRRAIERLTRSL